MSNTNSIVSIGQGSDRIKHEDPNTQGNRLSLGDIKSVTAFGHNLNNSEELGQINESFMASKVNGSIPQEVINALKSGVDASPEFSELFTKGNKQSDLTDDKKMSLADGVRGLASDDLAAQIAVQSQNKTNDLAYETDEPSADAGSSLGNGPQ